MCDHCGCRGVEPIAELMDEHLALLEIAGDLRRHLTAGDRAACAAAVERLVALAEQTGGYPASSAPVFAYG